MSKLLILKGLPASGKSTYAKELVAKGWKRVNKDDLRAMVDNGKWSKANEKLILSTETHLVMKYLKEGFNVVVDDTNFAHEQRWIDVARNIDVVTDFEVKFFDTPLKECIERDSKRGDKSVGKKVIVEMYTRYLKNNIPLIEWKDNLKSCYVFDIDGTLAIMKDRSPYDWKRVGEDSLNEPIAKINRDCQNWCDKIIVVSGRDSICRQETIDWLDKNNLKYDLLYMRPEGDTRKDTLIKEEIYNTYIKDQFNVLGVFDDRDGVVAMWRSKGLTCLQVADGNF